MKYIYYILAIMVIFSGLAAYGLFDTRIEVSEPVLSVNDRIFSASELDKLLKIDPTDMTRDHFIEALIEKQLLIQEAIRQEINKEESFRRSVQNFYEQSLIKTLLDRKYDSLVVDVSAQEVARYEELTTKQVVITKQIYPSLKDLEQQTNQSSQMIDSAFVDLSDDLKYVVLTTKKGVFSEPVYQTGQGMMMYRVDDILPLKEAVTQNNRPFDVKRVSLFIQGKKKEQIIQQWTRDIRNAADIWRK
jgi:hypothetical protein